MLVKKIKPTSNASRRVVNVHLDWKFSHINYLFSYKKKSGGGRNSSGRRVIRSIGSRTASLFEVKINRLSTGRGISLVQGYYFCHALKNLFTLVLSAKGDFSYVASGGFSQIFSFLYYHTKPHLKLTRRIPYSSQLFSLRPLQYATNLEILPHRGFQYARSAGSVAKLLTKNSLTHTALVKLPSGVRKVFSLYSFVLRGKPVWKNKNRLANTKFGYVRSFGRKSQVRGVAMNPIDHPHGGRTKSIKYPRTPWGFTTKFK